MPSKQNKMANMNIKLLIFSFLIITTLHYLFFSFKIEKEEITQQKQPIYQKVNIQLSKYEQVKIVEKEVIEKTIKEIPKEKELLKKTIIKKEKKKTEESKKTINKKPTVKKEEIEKAVEEKQIFKTQKNTEIKKVINEPKQINTINKKQEKLKHKYLQELRIAINNNKKYPKISKRLKEQGKVVLSFRVLKSGKFVNINIINSSGKKRLDNAALNAVIDTKSFKAIPNELNINFIDISLPIKFRLE